MSSRVTLPVPVEVDAPAALVWDYVTDWERQGEWMLGTRVHVTGGAGRGLGTTLRAVTGVGPVGVVDTMEVVEFAPPTTWTTATTEAPLPFRLIGTVAEGPAGSSRLTMRIELVPKGLLAKVFAPLRAIMQRTAKGNLARIKAAVEAG